MMNFPRNSLPTTPAAATPGSQANTPFGNAVLLDGNMITPLIALPQKQQLPAAAISNSVVDFQRAFQNVMPTTPTQSNNVGQTAEDLFRWWISQQGALVVVTSTNTPVTQNQTSTTMAAISPVVSNTNVVTVGMSPRANGISPRTNMPAMQSPILHSPVAMNQGQGISPRSISAMSPRNSMSNMNSPSVTNMHSPLSAMGMMAMASGSNQLKSLQAQQQQQAQQKPSQSPVKQMPNLSIGGLTPFVNAFNKFYDIFNCDLVDPIGNIVRKDEFPKTCLKEIFTDSKISEALMRRGYQLTPEDYQTLDYVLKINCFDECFAIFLRIYFKNINEVLINIDGEQRVIQYYKNIWKSYLMGSVVLETMYGGGNQETANMGTLMDQKSLHGGNLAGKVLLALKKWKEFFFNEKEDPYVCIPLAVRKLIEREFSGDGNHTELVSPEILNSYKILGIYPTKSTRLSDHPSPLEWFEFVRWHLIKFPVLPEPSNLTPKKPESMNMMVQPPPQMLRPTELSRSSELSRHELSFHDTQSAVDPDEYVEVVATPRPSPKPYTRKLERMRPPFMAPMNFISAANRSNSQPLFVQPQLPSQQNGTLNHHNTTNNNSPITPVNTTISLPMISSYLMQHSGTGMPLLPFRMPTLPHRTQSQHALLTSNNSMSQNGSIMSQTMEQNEGYNSCDDVSIINDKKAIRRIKNNEASRRYRARMREKRKEWAEKLRERDDSISKSPENPTITRDSTCQTSEMILKNESPLENKISEFSISLFSRESRESSLESFEPEIAERIVKKQLYKISRREKNNIAVRKYRHKRKQRIEMNKKELVYLSNRHIELLKNIEMLKKQMSVLLAFEGITDNEMLRAQVGKLENASAIAKNRFIDPLNLLETPSFMMYSEPDTIIIEESD